VFQSGFLGLEVRVVVGRGFFDVVIDIGLGFLLSGRFLWGVFLGNTRRRNNSGGSRAARCISASFFRRNSSSSYCPLSVGRSWTRPQLAAQKYCGLVHVRFFHGQHLGPQVPRSSFGLNLGISHPASLQHPFGNGQTSKIGFCYFSR
jgi:hypothetical protein